MSRIRLNNEQLTSGGFWEGGKKRYKVLQCNGSVLPCSPAGIRQCQSSNARDKTLALAGKSLLLHGALSQWPSWDFREAKAAHLSTQVGAFLFKDQG